LDDRDREDRKGEEVKKPVPDGQAQGGPRSPARPVSESQIKRRGGEKKVEFILKGRSSWQSDKRGEIKTESLSRQWTRLQARARMGRRRQDQ
jgi:hypothetical protein